MAKFPHGHDLSQLQLWDGLSYFITSDVVTMLLFNFYAYKQMMFAKLTMPCSYRAPGIKEYLDNFLQLAKTKKVTQ